MTSKLYAAHILVATVFQDSQAATVPIQENIVLLEATQGDDIWAIAEVFGRKWYTETADSGSTYMGIPARSIFVGVRRIVEPAFFLKDEVGNGTEVTYIEYELNKDDLEKLLRGEQTRVYAYDSAVHSKPLT